MRAGRALRATRWLRGAAAPTAAWRRRVRGLARSLVERGSAFCEEARAGALLWVRSWSRRLGRLRAALLFFIDAQRSRWLPRVDALRESLLPSRRERGLRWRHGRVSPNGPASLTWNYGLYTPRGLRDDEQAPLIVLLHGCTQRAVRFAHASGWTALADAARVRLLCPEQRRLANQHGCWNWFHAAAQNGRGEVGVVTAMIDDVETLVTVDGNAIAAAGISAGGALSTLLAFHCARRFRAVIAVGAPALADGAARMGSPDAASLAGADSPGCAPLAIIHGTADAVVHPSCADSIQERALDLLRRAGTHAESLRGVAADGRATVTDFRARGRLLVRRIDIKGHGHAWTGGPGGHRYCEPAGLPLTALCREFLRDVGVLA